MRSSNRELRETLETVAEGTAAVFRKAGRVRPFWHCEDSEGRQHIVPAPSPDKDVSAAIMREFMRAKNIVRRCGISEAWALQAASEAEAAFGRVAEHPRRKEIVVILAEDISGETLLAHFPIIREPGREPRLGRLDIGGLGELAGRFVGMLPSEGTKQ